MAPVFTLIGDLVGSRQAAARGRVQDALIAALAAASRVVAPLDRLEPTVGDEFQGVYGSFPAAALAGLVVRLNLDGVVDVRCGIGGGAREVFDAGRTPMLQDGPAWWSARAAVEALGGDRRRRTWYDDRHLGGDGPPAALANAYLTVRDALVDRLNPGARAMLLLALEGLSQREIAARRGVSESAVSQAVGRGVGAVRDAQRLVDALAAARAGDGGSDRT
jgi:DNA-binding CsgD family transcriptional regulator